MVENELMLRKQEVQGKKIFIQTFFKGTNIMHILNRYDYHNIYFN